MLGSFHAYATCAFCNLILRWHLSRDAKGQAPFAACLRISQFSLIHWANLRWKVSLELVSTFHLMV